MTKRTQAPKAGGRRDQMRQQAAAAAARRKQRRILFVGIGVVVAALVTVLAVVGVNALRSGPAAGGEVVPPNANADQTGIIANPGVAAEGAPVMTIYQDFQCPACKNLEDTLGATINEMAANGQVQLEYRTMTILDTNLANDASLRAGIASACADVAGAYDDYYAVLYTNQPQEARGSIGFTDNQLLAEFPAEAGLSGDALDTFKSCYRGKDTSAFIEGTDAAAAEAQVRSTPTIKINGEDFDMSPYYANPAGLPAAVEQLAG